MTIFTLEWNHADSPALSAIQIKLHNGDIAADLLDPHAQRAGSIEWDLSTLSAGATLTLEILVPYNPGGSLSNTRGTTAVNIQETLRYTAASPAITFANSGGRPPDPRFGATGPGLAGGQAPRLSIDLTFIDVTACFQGGDLPDDASKEEWDVNTMAVLSADHESRLRILRHTGGKPYLWAVYVPSALGSSVDAINTLVFYTPVHPDANREVGTASHNTPLRYLSSRQYPGLWGYLRHIQPDGWHVIWQPDCRFLDQVDDSGKPVLLVMPYYSGSNFGHAGGAQIIPMLRSLLTALWSGSWDYPADNPDGDMVRHQFIGGDVQSGLHLGNLGLSGFSYGGAQALRCWNSIRSHVDELYLFDPMTGHFNFSDYANELRAWLPGKRLRLIGGDALSHLTEARLHTRGASNATELVTGVPATVWPGSIDFFHTSRVYEHAFAWGQQVEQAEPRKISDQGSPESLLSSASHIHRDPASSGRTHRFFATLPSGEVTGPISVGEYGLVEISTYIAIAIGAIIHFEPAGPGRFLPVRASMPLGTRRHFARIIQAATSEGTIGAPPHYPRRHQWPAFGGQSETDSVDDWKGYLQLCLENSGFD